MAKLSALKIEDSPQKILVYGAPKTGKSLMVGQLAEHGYELYYFDGDNGVEVLFQLSMEAQERVTVYKIRDLPESPEFAKLANEFAGYRNFSVCEIHGKVNCIDCKARKAEVEHFDWTNVANNPKAVIVFDSGSQLVTSVQNHIARNESFDSFGAVDKDSKREWGHYMAQKLILDKFWTMVQNAPCKVVVISHETELDKEKAENKDIKGTIPTGGTSTQSKQLSKYFGHVVHCRIRNNLHKVVSGTTSDANVIAGSRLNIDVAKADRGLAAFFEMSGGVLEKGEADEVVVTATSNAPEVSTKVAAKSQLDILREKMATKK